MPATQAISVAGRTSWTLAAFRHILDTRLFRRKSRLLQSVACKTWEVAPGETTIAPPAFYLPGQLERVTDWAFSSEHPRQTMEGGQVTHGATWAFLLKDVRLIDGTLYKDDATSWLAPRSKWLPSLRTECEIDHGALYCTAMGNKYFGQWLMDDCVTYSMACREGIPVTTMQAENFHTRGYEDWLEMNPARLRTAYFRELVVFDDSSENNDKHLRFRAMTEKLLARVSYSAHAGVFILRGGTGELRLLKNEIEIAEHLRDHRGFRILDPTKSDVPTVVETCAGARAIVGVEGSQLIHGMLALGSGCSVLTLQPPSRFVSMYKRMTDRDHQHFGFVVGQNLPTDGHISSADSKRSTPWTGVGKISGFTIDPHEVERTLDLFPE